MFIIFCDDLLPSNYRDSLWSVVKVLSGFLLQFGGLSEQERQTEALDSQVLNFVNILNCHYL